MVSTQRHDLSSSRQPRLLVNLLVPVISILGLYWFSSSFFLAKRSLPHLSHCDESQDLLRTTLGLTTEEIKANHIHDPSKGCWLERRVDSVVILVVDALRFDFALYHLPESVGARLSSSRAKNNQTTSTQLLQFVADPPTVTMQRLKGLTTGSLPTFADISGNFGGSSIDEDSWVQQLKSTAFARRGLHFPSRLGFVGDDTWVDLFPTQFDVSSPYPSFNTRDLDTVDNGCLKELPVLLKDLRTTGEKPDELEVVVAHFLGVDHVGHTYGPHNQYMDQKLRQMDAAISTTLDLIDESKNCHVAFIFGDHGMTEDGNHGGGSENEINAALFAHFSPACGSMSLDLAPQIGSEYIQKQFQSIHQIDLVPTISVLLGLPIPYANLGGIVPTLLGFEQVSQTAAALALNAAQVWRYFTVYSSTANKLPGLPELQTRLDDAIVAYKMALAHPEADDSNLYYKACGLFKIFLVEASELGHRVWTRFDTTGMILGAAVVLVGLALCALSLFFQESFHWGLLQWDLLLTIVFVLFHCGLLTFSNSYIEAEQHIVMFMMATLGITVYIRWNTPGALHPSRITRMLPILFPVLSRFGEVFVSGHGMDPSIRLHCAHHPLMFLASLAILAGLRVYLYRQTSQSTPNAVFHTTLDCTTLVLLALSWLEKRIEDDSRNGYFWMRGTLAILVLGVPMSLYNVLVAPISTDGRSQHTTRHLSLTKTVTVVSKLLIFLMAVTGPATASTVVLFVVQAGVLYTLGGVNGSLEVRHAYLIVMVIRNRLLRKV
jgi:GPI ethanolamine phosphate transferase 3 subunit O